MLRKLLSLTSNWFSKNDSKVTKPQRDHMGINNLFYALKLVDEINDKALKNYKPIIGMDKLLVVCSNDHETLLGILDTVLLAISGGSPVQFTKVDLTERVTDLDSYLSNVNQIPSTPEYVVKQLRSRLNRLKATLIDHETIVNNKDYYLRILSKPLRDTYTLLEMFVTIK